MAANYLHGIETLEVERGPRAIKVVKSAVVAVAPTAETARTSLAANGFALVFPTLEAAAKAGIALAVEHVELAGRSAEARAARFAETAGAVFVGSDTPTAFGDYLAGPNHVLPTGGAARSFSGLSARDFLRWGRSVSVPTAAARRLAPAAATLARFEGLEAHARSLELRRARTPRSRPGGGAGGARRGQRNLRPEQGEGLRGPRDCQ